MPPKPRTQKINEIFKQEVLNRERQPNKGKNKARFAANVLANKNKINQTHPQSQNAKASELPCSYYNKIDTRNANESIEVFSTSSTTNTN